MALIALTPVQEAAAGVLVTKGILRKDVAPDLARAHRFLAQAADALAQLPAISSPAVAFNIAYDSAHDVGEALLSAYGYRTGSGPGAHVAVGDFLQVVFDSPPPSVAASSHDGLRQVRNGLRYRATTAGASQAAAASHAASVLLTAARARGI